MQGGSLLFASMLSVLFLAGGMATHAQTLDQTLSGCNVFSMGTGSTSGADARSNLLVGHWPHSGAAIGKAFGSVGGVLHG